MHAISSRTLPLYIHTISKLKAEQILYRLWYSVRARSPQLLQPKTKTTSQPFNWGLLRPRVPFPSCPGFDPDEVRRGYFRFLNESSGQEGRIDWKAQGKDRLWRYNLHYFKYLQSEGGIDKPIATSLMHDWIKNNPPGTNDAWDPFPLSLRIVNWIKFFTQTNCYQTEIRAIIQSLYQQVQWLEWSLERHLLGNHLFKNLKALVFAGLFFQGRDADRWRKKGISLLLREIHEQILPDGSHFERSPMYHSMILEDSLDLLNIIYEESQPEYKNLKSVLLSFCPDMAKFLAGMLHPDQQIALFNDSAFDIELPATRLLDYASSLVDWNGTSAYERCWSFPQTGYYVIAPAEGDRMVIDCGPLGPDYQLGHAHCDTLSYELSLGGQRIIVDSGVHDYQKSKMRHYVRSTRAHNTIMIDGKEQSEIWGAFRVARRAKPIYARIEKIGKNKICFSGAHDGYKRLRGKVIHERFIEYDETERWTVTDRVTGKQTHLAENFIHIHPCLKAVLEGSQVKLLDRRTNKRKARIIITSNDNVSLVKGWYCPEFGLKQEQDVVVLSKTKALPIEMKYKILKN